MHHLTCGISSLLHSVNLILFTLLLVHLILRMSPHHSHHLRSHNLSLLQSFTPDLKLISFTNPFLHSHSYSFQTAFTYLNLYWIKGALAFVCFSFFFIYIYIYIFFWLHVLEKAEYSAFESTLTSSWFNSSCAYHLITADHLHSHHLSLHRPFTPDLKLISFTNPFLHSHSYSFRTAFMHLNLYWIKGALALF